MRTDACIFESLQLEGPRVGGFLVLLLSFWGLFSLYGVVARPERPWGHVRSRGVSAQSDRSQVFHVQRSWGSEPRVPPSGTVTSEAGHWPRALEHGQAEAALPHLAPCPPPLAPCAAWAVGSVGCWAPGGAGREWAGQRGPHCATRFCFCLVMKREALIIPVQRHDVWGVLDVCHYGPGWRDRMWLVWERMVSSQGWVESINVLNCVVTSFTQWKELTLCVLLSPWAFYKEYQCLSTYRFHV